MSTTRSSTFADMRITTGRIPEMVVWFTTKKLETNLIADRFGEQGRISASSMRPERPTSLSVRTTCSISIQLVCAFLPTGASLLGSRWYLSDGVAKHFAVKLLQLPPRGFRADPGRRFDWQGSPANSYLPTISVGLLMSSTGILESGTFARR